MAINSNLLQKQSNRAIHSNLIQRPSDRSLFLVAAIGFPLVVLLGFFKSYYFKMFFDAPPIANSLVHLHGVVMTLWVIYFTVQVALIQSKNIKLHIAMGTAGIALAIVVFVVGFATAYNSQIVRRAAPAGIDPHKFFLIPAFDMILFAIFFGGAIYFRKRIAEHKSLMLLTAINFSASPISRIPLGPADFTLVWAFGVPILVALVCLGWHTWKHRKLNKVFAAGVLLFITSLPLRIAIGETEIWLNFANWLAS